MNDEIITTSIPDKIIVGLPAQKIEITPELQNKLDQMSSLFEKARAGFAPAPLDWTGPAPCRKGSSSAQQKFSKEKNKKRRKIAAASRKRNRG